MNVNEAITLTAQLQPKLAIPMHYGMFAENTEDPNLFLEGCAQHQIKAMALSLGKTVSL
jgi:L-ascorbate metabolism protein UlaG (beta-lactamase superfamily)